MSSGTLVYDGNTYPMAFKQFPNSFQFNQIGVGALTVASGNQWSGSYPSTPVAVDSNGYLWVWPAEQFSMISTVTEGQPSTTGTGTGTGTGTTTGTGTGTTTTTTTFAGLTTTEILIIVGIVALVVIAYLVLWKHKA